MSSDALAPPLYSSSSSSAASSSPSVATSAIIVVIVIASAVILSVSIYLLLRSLSRHFSNRRRRRHQTHPNDVVLSRRSSSSGDPGGGDSLLDLLPVFTLRSATKGSLAEGDCAVCLSRFEPDDRLRLLPLCCHAFHAACIDAWIVANRTCPLCRSVVVPTTDRDVMDKINRSNDHPESMNESDDRSRSFRIEMGSVSRRRNGGGSAAEGDRRSYSIGSFEYIVDQIRDYDVSVVDFVDKEYPQSTGDAAADAIAAEVGGGGGRSGSNNWLRDYVDRLGISSRALSFRSSGRFFSGSSRRSEAEVAAAAVDDLEANRVGEEISELFRWLSGV